MRHNVKKKGCRILFWPVLAIGVLAVIVVCQSAYHHLKPMPDEVSIASPPCPVAAARFLRDLTYLDAAGGRCVEQAIFDEVLRLVHGAERLIVVDMFLYNDFLGEGPPPVRNLCSELTQALIARKQALPGLRAVVITDPINTVYGGTVSPHFEQLKDAGVEVVLTDLDPLPDSNPLWSGLWRTFIQPFGTSPGETISNPFGQGRTSVRSLFRLLNFKANHRKLIVADGAGDLHAVVTSANPHDGSSAHGNVGLAFTGAPAYWLLRSEQGVYEISGGTGGKLADFIADITVRYGDRAPAAGSEGNVTVSVVSEKFIARAAEQAVDEAGPGAEIDVVMFYLSDRRLIKRFKGAAKRGVAVRVILDPNKDAFGRVKSGMPNRQAARELNKAGISVRWADTHGEQAHTKLLLVRSADGRAEMLLGSANFTRRNLRDYNLETDVLVQGMETDEVIADAADYVDTLWSNRDGKQFTTGYDTYRDDSALRVLRCRIMEATGLCTW